MIDLEFHDEGRSRSSFLLQPPLLRHDGNLYGGTAIAASILAMEAAADRPVLWVTTQFVASTPSGHTIDMHCETLAAGKRIAQLRVTGSVEGAVQFMSLGSAGTARDGGLDGTYEEMPTVTPPHEAAAIVPGPPGSVETPDEPTFRRMCEYRQAAIISTPRQGSNPVAMWARFKDGRPMTPAGIAFSADMVPLAVARAAGKVGAGTSLDNSLRFGHVPDVEWVLLDMQGNMAAGGYGHGMIRVWSEAGDLLAVGSQTASMIYVFDEDGLPGPRRGWPQRP